MKANPIVVRKVIAVVSILIGGCICVGAGYPALRKIFTDPGESFNYLVMLPMMAAMAVIGVIPIGAGFTLYRRMDEGALKLICGLGAVLLTVSILGRLSWIGNPMQVQYGLFTLGATVVACMIYLITLRKLLELFGQGKPRFIWLMNHLMFGITAWHLAMPLMALSNKYMLGEMGADHPVLGILAGFAPFVLPFVGYKLAVGWLERARRDAMPFEIHLPSELDLPRRREGR